MRTRITVPVLAALLLLGAPALTACGNVAEQAAEKAAEQAVGGNVDITDDGVKVEASGGNEIQIGADVAVPDNWPSVLPVPEGAKLTTVMIAGDGSALNASWDAGAPVADTFAAYDAALAAAGFTKDNNVEAEGMSSADYSGNGYTVNVVAADAGGRTTLMINASKG